MKHPRYQNRFLISSEIFKNHSKYVFNATHEEIEFQMVLPVTRVLRFSNIIFPALYQNWK